MTLWPIVAVIALIAARVWGLPTIGAHAPKEYFDILYRATNIALVVGVATVVDGAIRYFYWHGYLKRRRNLETPALIQDIVTVALLFSGVALGFWWQAGLSFTGIAAASGAVAFVLGIALQPVIQDLFSGLSINFDGSYSLGDWITVYSDQMPEPAHGRVTGINWRTTFITLEDGRRMMFPNRLITSNPIANHSRPSSAKQLSVDIEVDVRLPQDQIVHLILGEALKVVRDPALAQHPAPIVLIKQLTADAAVYEVRFHYHPDQITISRARSRMLRALHELLQQRELPLPVTQVELTQPPVLEPPFAVPQIRQALGRVRLFHNVLDDEQLNGLAAQSLPKTLMAGAVLMRQGEPATSMFVIVEGAASVTLEIAGGTSHEVAVSAAGDVAGEMSLMTGAPRSATVSAMTRLRVLEITKEAMQQLLDRRPELFERFTDVLVQKQRELDALAQRHSSQAASEVDILSRMKAFFSRSLGIT